jgi:3-oxoacyl-[acyl-carrier protein] reductase
MQDLSGKVAVVTGASRDIGRATAVYLASQGVKVAVNYCNDEAAGQATIAEVEKHGGSAILVKGDMMVKADVDALIAETLAAFGSEIHILVNNVGGLVERRTIDVIDEAFLNHVMSLNFTSTFLATQAVVPHMTNGGSIINLGSLAGRDGGGGGASIYGASKGAVMTFTRAMAKELGPKGIRINGLAPGMIDTTFHDTFTPDEARRNVEATVPLRRQGLSEDCAHAIAFLASDASAYITGANIDINGGMAFS